MILFICSTTGQGELPRNTKRFWKFLLRRKLPATLLTSVKFTTFGLGDTSYPRYNWAIRKLHTRLLNLGAKAFADRGEGDEQSSEGVDKVYQEWENNVCDKLSKLYPLPESVEPIALETLLPPVYPLKLLDSKLKVKTESPEVGLSRCEHGQEMKLFRGSVVKNERITAQGHFQDVRKLVFKNSGDEAVQYVPGDTVALYPSNFSDDVQALLDHQGWADIADYKVEVSEDFERTVFGGLVQPLTVRSLLTYHLDIMAIPRRSFFASVWYFAKDSEREQERLLEFTTIDGLDDLYDYANRPRRSILETITEFDSLKIPIEYILDVFPVLRPRLFSIASPIDKQEIELAVAIVKYKTIIRRIRRGVCTRYIESLKKGDFVPFSIHSNGLYHAKSYLSNTKVPGGNPLILMATGTGVAPVISIAKTLLQDTVKRTQPIWLFFGCRNYEKDFHFKEDWEQLVKEYGDLLKVHVAFSRDTEIPKDQSITAAVGVHMQALLYSHKQELSKMLKNDDEDQPESVLYLCGASGKMPREVRITLTTILQETVPGWDELQAEEYMLGMEQRGRFIQETW